MSYTSELKNDLFESLPKRKKARYLLAGIILASGHFEFGKDRVDFTLTSENPTQIRFVYRLVLEHYDQKGIFSVREKTGFHRKKTYCLSFLKAGDLLGELGCVSKLGDFYYSPVLNDILLKGKKAKKAFLKGVFIGCGSILNPNANYHLEIDPLYSAITEVCVELLMTLGIECTAGRHNNRDVIYIRDSDSIADFLALVGAHKKYFEFEDMKIFRQMRGDINRRINFETANINKTALAASRQIKAIEKLKESGRYESLSPDLKQIAELRVAHPTISINKLTEKAKFKISRSSLHRRLKRIIEMAEENE